MQLSHGNWVTPWDLLCINHRSWFHSSQVLAKVPKQDLKRNWKGPSKQTQGPFHCYKEDVFYATYWLNSALKPKWWSNSILVACIGINWRLWAHLIYNQKWYDLPWLQHGGHISSASSSHITICGTAAKMQLPVHNILSLGAPTLTCCSQMDYKGTDNNGKDLLTNRKDPYGLNQRA